MISKTNITNNFNSPKLVELDNKNIMIVGFANSSYNCHMMIVDNQGNTIKSDTVINSPFYGINLLKLSNGNILLYGYYPDGSYYGDIAIYDQEGTPIKTVTSIGNYYQNIYAIETSDHKIAIAGSNYTSLNSHISIYNLDGSLIRNVSITNGMQSPKIIEMSNHKLLIVGNDSSNKINVSICNLDGTNLTNYSDKVSGILAEAVELSTGNILIVSNDSSVGNLYAVIIDKNANVIRSYPSYIGSYHMNNKFNKILKMSNGNILIVGYYNNNGYAGYAMMLDNEGNIVKSSTLLHQYFANTHMLEMSDGNIMITGNVSTSSNESNIMILKPYSDSFNVTINNVVCDTAIEKDKFYELVYDQTLNKFIGEEVRNAN